MWNSTIDPGQPWVITNGNASLRSDLLVDEMDVEPIDLGGVLVEPVQRRLTGAPVVVVGPVVGQLAGVGKGNALAPVVDALGLRPSRLGQPRPQVIEVSVGNGDAKRVDRGHPPILSRAISDNSLCTALAARTIGTMKSYDAGPTDTPILEETIGDNFERTVLANPDNDALVDMASNRRWTYAELNDEIDVVARGLMALGIERGERVGMWAPNCPEWTIVQYATAKIGAILVNINPAYRTHELAYVLKQSGVRTLISATDFKGSDYVGMVDEVRSETPDLLRRVVPRHRGLGGHCEPAPTAIPADDLRARMATLDNKQPINIQYTSGTTGFPKGATLSHRNILNNGFFTTELINLGPDDRLCIPVPFYHCFGMVMGNLGCTSHGTTIVIPAPAFDPGLTLDAIEKERCTAVYGVPTMFIAMLAMSRSGRPRPVIAAHRHHGRVGVPRRGDEALHQRHEHGRGGDRLRHDRDVTGVVPDPNRRRPRAAHRIDRPGPSARGDQDRRPGHRRDRRARRAPASTARAGYSVMLGYWQDEAKTREAVDEDGWMHTGDLAVMRDDGYCNIVGRIKDMVIRGGENIYPREIEEFLYTHPDIEDAQVIGVPDEKYGEEICAWIRMKPGKPRWTRRPSANSRPASWPTTRSRATSTSSASSR